MRSSSSSASATATPRPAGTTTAPLDGCCDTSGQLVRRSTAPRRHGSRPRARRTGRPTPAPDAGPSGRRRREPATPAVADRDAGAGCSSRALPLIDRSPVRALPPGAERLPCRHRQVAGLGPRGSRRAVDCRGAAPDRRDRRRARRGRAVVPTRTRPRSPSSPSDSTFGRAVAAVGVDHLARAGRRAPPGCRCAPGRPRSRRRTARRRTAASRSAGHRPTPCSSGLRIAPIGPG